ncbi:MAG: hypothetical protein JW940_29025 [Polyangiaceae bacterium]|nr:hypothetical protein [Polyangiaceae bacterium]
MGWNSWNKLACQVNNRLIRATADAMDTTGMRDTGYRYINIDDCRQGRRDGRGSIQPDAARFPSGMKALADYIHSRGLGALSPRRGTGAPARSPGSLRSRGVAGRGRRAPWLVRWTMLASDRRDSSGQDGRSYAQRDASPRATVLPGERRTRGPGLLPDAFRPRRAAHDHDPWHRRRGDHGRSHGRRRL